MNSAVLQHSPLTCPLLNPSLPLLETSLPSWLGLLISSPPVEMGCAVRTLRSSPITHCPPVAPVTIAQSRLFVDTRALQLCWDLLATSSVCHQAVRICLIRSHTLASAFLASLSLGTIAGSLGPRPMPASLWILDVIETLQLFPQLSAPQPLCDLSSLPLHNPPGSTPFCLPTHLRVLHVLFQCCFPIPMGALISAFFQQVWKSPIPGASLPPLCLLPTCSCTTGHCVTGASEFIIPDAGGVPPLLLVATWNLGMMSGAPVAILDHLATREVKTLC